MEGVPERDLGIFGRIWGGFGIFKISPRISPGGFREDFGRISGGFWEDFGRISGGFGIYFLVPETRFGKDLTQILPKSSRNPPKTVNLGREDFGRIPGGFREDLGIYFLVPERISGGFGEDLKIKSIWFGRISGGFEN